MKSVAALGALMIALVAGCSSMPGGAGQPRAAAAAMPAPADYDQQMRMMREMHQKMAAARTPEECAALMNEHMKIMHGGMAMMGQMHGGTMGGGMGMGAGKGPGGGAMPMDPEMMAQRMDMMEMMMQMMMDRDGMKPPAAK